MNKNDEFEVEIAGYTSEGQGVARQNGFVVFVPFAVLGERVKVHIIKVNKTYAVGKIVEILQTSPDRIQPLCPYFKKCGGCDFQHIKPEKVLDIKQTIVKDALERIGGFENINVKNTSKSPKNYNYRNKSAFPIATNQEGAGVCMFKVLSHDPVFVENCQIASEPVNKAIKVFNEFLKTLPRQQQEKIDFVVVRALEGKMLFTLVAKEKVGGLDGLFDLLKSGLKLTDESLGFFWCKKNLENNVILEGELVHLFGIDHIECEMMGVKVDVSPMSFFQVNQWVMEKIYAEVVSCFDIGDVVVDAYSGAGLMSALIAKKAKKVFAIEIVKEASRDADKTKQKNHIKNLVNINGDTNKVLPDLVKKIGDFSLVVDPPRKGMEKSVIETVTKSAPKKIVYVSCNPSSLARDAKLIAAGGYKIASVQPFDMFPQTRHVETLAVFEKI